MNAKPFVFLFVLLFSVSLAQDYEGKTKTVEYYHAQGDTRESFKTLWFCDTFEEYNLKETDNFDGHHIAYHNDKFQIVCTESDEKMLNMLGIQTGMYRGYYYPLKSRKVAENIQNTYMAFFAVPLNVFDVHINFVGVQRQYMLNYELKPAKENREKTAFFRIPSGEYRYDEDYELKADVTDELVTITMVYNHQTLMVTLTPKENLFMTYMRKWGFNDEPLISLQDSSTTLADSIGTMLNEN